jgi:hypothetical protein
VKPRPEGPERMWAMVRWRNGRLEVRRGLPPGLLAIFCRIGLHFMTRSVELDGYACRCRRQTLRSEEIWRGTRTERTTPVNEGLYWLPQIADPERPTRAELEGGVRLDEYIATPPAEVPASFPNVDAMLAELVAGTCGIPAEISQGTPSTGDVLNRIDRAVDGLCPCGAEPRDGSAYCSYDCEPCDPAPDGDEHPPTEMRWRPDLVTAAPDDGLEPVTDAPPLVRYAGCYNATTYRRAGSDVWHLRLDDGHRYVGRDLDVDLDATDAAERIVAAYAALERELRNPRHAVPGMPVQARCPFTPPYDTAITGVIDRAGTELPADTITVLREDGTPLVAGEDGYRLEAGQTYTICYEFGAGPAVWAGLRQGRAPQPERDPLEQALASVQNRNTGPATIQRPPRRIDPRGAR